MKLDSATYFSKSQYTDWQKRFGEQTLIRVNFKRITGINRKSGHEAIIELQTRLGGSDEDWNAIRKAGGYVTTTGTAATVRQFTRQDYVKVVSAAVFGVAVLALACYLVAQAIIRSQKVSAGNPSFQDLEILFFAIAYAMTSFLWSWVMFLQVREMFSADRLRHRLAMTTDTTLLAVTAQRHKTTPASLPKP